MQKYHFSWTLVTYNVVIDIFGRASDLKHMDFLFRLMQTERIKPNCITFCSLVRVYDQAGKANKIGGVWRIIENSDVTLDSVFFNCLVDAYGMMGCFMEMKGFKPDKVTYKMMIKTYSIGKMTSHLKELHDVLASLKGSHRTRKIANF